MQLRNQIQELAKHVGLDVRSYRPVVRDPVAATRFLLSGQPCRIVFDVGGYHGDMTAAFRAAFPQADIYTFEPYPPTFELLTQRFSADERVHLFNAAVSGDEGDATFHMNEHAGTNSLLPRPASGRRYFASNADSAGKITVPTVALDDFCQQQNIAGPDVLKLDIQGNELTALRGAERLLQAGHIAVIYTEVTFVPHYEGGVLFHELAAHLAQRGYTLFNLYDLHSASVGQLRFGDALFISDRLRKSFLDKLPEEA